MRVEFWMREPGNHHCVATADMSAVPRMGEAVTVQKGGIAYYVHSVSYEVDVKHNPVARVLLIP